MMPRGPSLSDGCTPLVAVEFPQNLEQARPRALGDALERSEELGIFLRVLFRLNLGTFLSIFREFFVIIWKVFLK